MAGSVEVSSNPNRLPGETAEEYAARIAAERERRRGEFERRRTAHNEAYGSAGAKDNLWAEGGSRDERLAESSGSGRTRVTDEERYASGEDADNDGVDDGVAARLDETSRGWREDPDRVRQAQIASGRAAGTRWDDSGSPGTPLDSLVGADEGVGNVGTTAEADLASVWDDLESSVPTTESMRASAEGYDAALEGDTALRRAKADPLAIAAQRKALEGLAGQYNARGLQAIDKAALHGGIEQEQMRRAAQQRALQSMAAKRGMRGGGQEIAGALGAQQQMARGISDRGVGIENEAQRRALATLGARSGIAGQMRGQGFDERSRAALAQDEINMRNQNRTNESRATLAGARNAANAQNAGIAERRFNMSAGIAAGKAGRAEEEDDRRRAAAEAAAANDREVRGAVTTAATEGARYLTSDDDDEEDD